MNTNMQFMVCDGSLAAVFTYRTQSDTVAGTVWRFILDGQTLVVVPYQSPHMPAPAAHCVPERIETVLSELEFVVYCVAQLDANRNDEASRAIDEASETELAKWKAMRKWPALDKWDCDRTAAHQERERRWKERGLAGDDTPPAQVVAEWKRAEKDVATETRAWITARHKARREIESKAFAFLNDPQRMKVVKAERDKLDAKRQEIEVRLRKPVEAPAAKKQARERAEVLLRLNELIAKHGGISPVQLPPQPAEAKRYDAATSQKIIKALTDTKTMGGTTLQSLFDFIRQEVCRGKATNPLVRDENLRRVLAKVKELTGADLAESLTLTSSPDMPPRVAELARQTAEVEKIGEDEARRKVLEQIRFVAGFPDGSRCLIQAVTLCVHEAKDSKVFHRVEPGEAKRKEIAAQLKAVQEEGAARREQMVMMKQFLERNPSLTLNDPAVVTSVADKHVRRSYIKDTYNLSDQEITKRVDAGLLKEHKRKGKDGKLEGRANFYKSEVDRALGRTIT